MGFHVMVAYGFAAVGMVVIGASSDRFAERRWHVAGSMALCLGGMVALSAAGGLVAVLAGASLSHLLARWSPPSVLRVASVLLVALLVAHGLGISRALPLPETYRAVTVHRDEADMFAGRASRDKDPRESLHVEQVPVPELGPGEAIVAVMASAINYTTVWSAIFEPMPTFGFQTSSRIGRASKSRTMPRILRLYLKYPPFVSSARQTAIHLLYRRCVEPGSTS